MKLVDTNVLLDYPKVVEEDNIVLAIRVLEEIDGLKKSSNRDLAKKARKVSRAIYLNKEKIHFKLDQDKRLSVDNYLIKMAKRNKYELITNDINMAIKCKAEGVSTSFYKKQDEMKTNVYELYFELDENGYNNDIDKILNNQEVYDLKDIKENDYIIMKEKSSSEVICIVKKSNGFFKIVDNDIILNSYEKITPKNPEQSCLINALNDKNISIILATGTFGVGKSYLLINYAFQELEKGNINKIIYVPNNSFNENTREIGALPGDLIEKEIIHMGSLIDIAGDITVEDMIANGKIEVVPVSVIRGRNFDNSIIIVNEAQNLTEDHIKLLIARCGKNSKILFDGDVKQADKDVFREKSGLRLLTQLRNSEEFSKIFAAVKLKGILRSHTAQASAYLDEIS